MPEDRATRCMGSSPRSQGPGRPVQTRSQPDRRTATGLEVTASAARFTVPWESLREFAGSIQREALMVVAYADGKAIQRTIFRIPAPSSIDPRVIASQERLLLQSLLRTRDQRGGLRGRDQARPWRSRGRGVRESCRPGSPDRGVPREDRMVRGRRGGQPPPCPGRNTGRAPRCGDILVTLALVRVTDIPSKSLKSLVPAGGVEPPTT